MQRYHDANAAAVFREADSGGNDDHDDSSSSGIPSSITRFNKNNNNNNKNVFADATGIGAAFPAAVVPTVDRLEQPVDAAAAKGNAVGIGHFESPPPPNLLRPRAIHTAAGTPPYSSPPSSAPASPNPLYPKSAGNSRASNKLTACLNPTSSSSSVLVDDIDTEQSIPAVAPLMGVGRASRHESARSGSHTCSSTGRNTPTSAGQYIASVTAAAAAANLTSVTTAAATSLFPGAVTVSSGDTANGENDRSSAGQSKQSAAVVGAACVKQAAADDLKNSQSDVVEQGDVSGDYDEQGGLAAAAAAAAPMTNGGKKDNEQRRCHEHAPRPSSAQCHDQVQQHHEQQQQRHNNEKEDGSAAAADPVFRAVQEIPPLLRDIYRNAPPLLGDFVADQAEMFLSSTLSSSSRMASHPVGEKAAAVDGSNDRADGEAERDGVFERRLILWMHSALLDVEYLVSSSFQCAKLGEGTITSAMRSTSFCIGPGFESSLVASTSSPALASRQQQPRHTPPFGGSRCGESPTSAIAGGGSSPSASFGAAAGPSMHAAAAAPGDRWASDAPHHHHQHRASISASSSAAFSPASASGPNPFSPYSPAAYSTSAGPTTTTTTANTNTNATSPAQGLQFALTPAMMLAGNNCNVRRSQQQQQQQTAFSPASSTTPQHEQHQQQQQPQQRSASHPSHNAQLYNYHCFKMYANCFASFEALSDFYVCFEATMCSLAQNFAARLFHELVQIEFESWALSCEDEVQELARKVGESIARNQRLEQHLKSLVMSPKQQKQHQQQQQQQQQQNDVVEPHVESQPLLPLPEESRKQNSNMERELLSRREEEEKVLRKAAVVVNLVRLFACGQIVKFVFCSFANDLADHVRQCLEQQTHGFTQQLGLLKKNYQVNYQRKLDMQPKVPWFNAMESSSSSSSDDDEEDEATKANGGNHPSEQRQLALKKKKKKQISNVAPSVFQLPLRSKQVQHLRFRWQYSSLHKAALPLLELPTPKQRNTSNKIGTKRAMSRNTLRWQVTRPDLCRSKLCALCQLQKASVQLLFFAAPSATASLSTAAGTGDSPGHHHQHSVQSSGASSPSGASAALAAAAVGVASVASAAASSTGMAAFTAGAGEKRTQSPSQAAHAHAHAHHHHHHASNSAGHGVASAVAAGSGRPGSAGTARKK